VSEATSIRLGAWRADRPSGRLTGPDGDVAVEPKVMDLLFFLAERQGAVVSREALMAGVWPGVTVGDDALARCVSKLRKALGDDPHAPRYLETISKRGYRLLEPPVDAPRRSVSAWPRAAGLAAVLLAVAATGAVTAWPRPAPASESTRRTRFADDFYYQYTRADNEAAIALYEQVIAADPGYAPARAGLANALVQRVIRWPSTGIPPGRTQLGAALASGRTATPQARAALLRARGLAEEAVRLAPRDPVALRALGFVRSAGGDLDGAAAMYRRAIAEDPDAWGARINLADVSEIAGRDVEALAELERAYAAMTRTYDREPTRIRPWRAELGAAIADRHARAGDPRQAEFWYRQVLAYAPLHRAATTGLAGVLARSGDPAAARALCVNLVARAGPEPACAPWFQPAGMPNAGA
jgi:transcriptional activator of cad operon